MTVNLRSVAERSDARIADARAELVEAVRRAYRDGMSQAEIAREIGRSQPEVNRLLRFHGATERGRTLRAKSGDVRRLVEDAGGRKVRVFGSTARGDESEGSDIDLLFEMKRPLSLMQLSALEHRLSEVLGARVDLVPESSLRPDLLEPIRAQAVPL